MEKKVVTSDEDFREHGFVMLVVLWVLTSAVVLVSSFNGAVRGSTAAAISETGWTKSEALLDGGLEIATAHLADQDDNRRWPGNAAKHTIRFEDSELTIAVTDANGLIDLNKSDEKLLRAFLQKFTRSPIKAKQATDIILKARDAANGTNTQNQTEAVSSAAPNPFSAHSAFIDVWQLGRMPGIEPDLFNRVAPFLTVYSRDGTIDPSAAPREVLEAIPELNQADIVKLRYADKSAIRDIAQKAQAYLTDQTGPAYLIRISAYHPGDSYGITRSFVVAIGVDSSAPYRLLTKSPMVSTPAERTP